MEPEKTGNQLTPPATAPQTPPSDPTSVTPPADPTPTTPPSDPTSAPTTTAPTPPVEESKPSLSEEQVASMRKDITEEVSGDVSKSVIQKIGDALGLTRKEEEKLPTDAESLKKLIDAEVGKQFSRVSKDAEKQDREDADTRQTRIDSTIKGWHFQYNELARIGKIPVIKDAVDTNDEGIVARRKLILAIGKIIDEIRQADPNSDYIPSVSEALVRFPNILKGPPGGDLPISGNTAVRESTDSFSYEKDVAGKSFEQIVNEGS